MQKAAQLFNQKIVKKEKQLEKIVDLNARLSLLKELSEYYSFTQHDKSIKYLNELKQLSLENNNQEYQAYAHAIQSFLENQKYNYNGAILHLQAAKKIFEEQRINDQIANAYIELGGSYFNLNSLDESDIYLEQASRFVSEEMDGSIKAKLLHRKAQLYTRRFVYDKTIDLLFEAKWILESQKEEITVRDYYILALIYSGLGYSYMKLEKIKESAKSYLKTIEICETFGFKMRLSWYYNHAGNAYSALGKYKKASKYFKKAKSNTYGFPNNEVKASAYANLGQIGFIKGDFKQALKMYKNAKALYLKSKGNDANFNASVLERYRAHLFGGEGKINKALKHYKAAIKLAVKSNDYKQMSAVYKDLSDFYEELDDYKKAFEYRKRFTESRDKFIDEERDRVVTELEVKYETEKKERETELLRLQTTELQLKALRAQMNPHFIFNSLNSIQGYITSDNPEQATIFFAKFSRLIRNSLEFSEFDVIPLEDEVQFLEDYLTLEKERFKGDFDFSIYIDDEVEEDIMGIPPMIIQPYIENCIKHGVRNVKNGFVKLSFEMIDDENLICTIEDNGIGRELASVQQKEYQDSSHRSMGAMITKERLDLFNDGSNKQLSTKTIDLKDENGNPIGTKVEVRIPIMEIDKNFYNH